MDRQQLARMIDHTILKAEATEADIRQVVAEAVEHRFASVCVNPRWAELVARLLEEAGAADEMQTDRPVATCACVGFPLGANRTTVKALEASSCVKDGRRRSTWSSPSPRCWRTILTTPTTMSTKWCARPARCRGIPSSR